MKPNPPDPETALRGAHARSSRRRYLAFLSQYRRGRLEDEEGGDSTKESAESGPGQPANGVDAAAAKRARH